MAKPVFEAREGENVFAQKATADCWKSPKQTISRQVSGKTYVTDQRIVFLASGLVGTESVSWEIEMKRHRIREGLHDTALFPFWGFDHDERRQQI